MTRDLSCPGEPLGALIHHGVVKKDGCKALDLNFLVAQVPYMTTCCLVGPHGNPSIGWALGSVPGSGEAVSPVEQIPSSRRRMWAWSPRSPLEESTRGRGAKAKRRVGHSCVLALAECLSPAELEQPWWGTWGGQPGWE